MDATRFQPEIKKTKLNVCITIQMWAKYLLAFIFCAAKQRIQILNISLKCQGMVVNKVSRERGMEIS